MTYRQVCEACCAFHLGLIVLAISLMLKKDYTGQDCSIARSLEVVGERWTLLIIRELMNGKRRFSEIERGLGIAKNILSNRLESLDALGVVKKVVISPGGEWVEYRLTAKGRDLFPVINALMAWGDKYVAPDGPPVTLLHRCGGKAGHRMVCACCGEDLHMRDVYTAEGIEKPASRGKS
jgi:DNA-binding HxlR family transcriptional regulator